MHCPKCKTYYNKIHKTCPRCAITNKLDYLANNQMKIIAALTDLEEKLSNLHANCGLNETVTWYVLKELGWKITPADTYAQMVEKGIFKKEKEDEVVQEKD